MNSDDEHREPTTEEVLSFCRKWAADANALLSKRMNETARKIAEAARNARLTPPDGMIDVSKCAEGFNPWEPHSIRKPAWIDARQRRPPIPERRPLEVRKWQARQAAKRKAGKVNRRRARRK
jgi:hypothetical protein